MSNTQRTIGNLKIEVKSKPTDRGTRDRMQNSRLLKFI